MHYRLTRIQHSPESLPKIKSYLDSVSEEIASIDGLHSVTLISVSDTETVGFSLYETEEKMIDAAEKQQKVLGGMAEYFSSTPNFENGDVIWKWSR